MRIIQHTAGFKKEDMMETVHGTIPAHQWLDDEAARIGKDVTRFVEIRSVGVGRKALFVNDIGVTVKGGYVAGRKLKQSEAQ